MGINNIKKCTFSFLSGAAVTAVPGYTGSFGVCQQPGRNIYRRVLPFLTALDTKSFPGAPGATQMLPEALEKMADFREFGSLN